MKILVIFTGGTIGSSANNRVISPNEENTRLLLEMYKNEYGADTQFVTAQPYYTLSENNTGKTLSQLISFVCNKMNDDYSGIIVTHGTDTLQFSAAALSYALGSDCKPVMLISSNFVLTDNRANGLSNFSAAFDFIKGGYGKGVFVPYKNSDGAVYIHRASRLLPHSELSDDVFSIKNQYYGSYNGKNFIKNSDYTAGKDEVKPFGKALLSDFSSELMVIQPYVGFEYPKIHKNTKAVLIKTYHSGTICTDCREFFDFAAELKQKNIPCYICGAENRDIYESAKAYKEFGFTILPPSAFIAQFIKLWLSLETGIDFSIICNKSLGEDLL